MKKTVLFVASLALMAAVISAGLQYASRQDAPSWVHVVVVVLPLIAQMTLMHYLYGTFGEKPRP